MLNQKKKKQITGAWKLPIIGILGILAGMAVIVYAWGTPYFLSKSARSSWVQLPAVVVSHSQQSGFDGRSDYSLLLYEYQYEGKKYTSSRYSFSHSKPLLSTKKIVAGYDGLTCYVNPRKPSEAVIYPYATPYSNVVLIIATAIVLAGVLALLSPLWHHARQTKPLPSIDVIAGQDPLAKTINWDPLPDTSASFTTYKLINSAGRCLYRPSFIYFLVCTIFWGATICGIYYSYQFSKNFRYIGTIALVLSILAMLAAILTLVCFKRIHFDKDENLFSTDYFWFKSKKRNGITLSDIYALQLLPKYNWVGDSSDYISYQINLVLTDGQRIHVVSHSSLRTARTDAMKLADFIGNVPIWDKTLVETWDQTMIKSSQ